MTDGFAQAVFGIAADNPNGKTLTALARSEGITLQSADLWLSASTLAPHSAHTTSGVFQLDTVHFVAAFAESSDDDNTTHYKLIRVPRSYARTWAGNINGLRAALRPGNQTTNALPPHPIPAAKPWSSDAQRTALAGITEAVGGIQAVAWLLGAAISRERLLIYNAPPSEDERLRIVSGLAALLPACARADLTYSTHVAPEQTDLNGRVVFSQRRNETTRYQFNWATLTFDAAPTTLPAYAAQYDSSLGDDIDAVLQRVAGYKPLAHCEREGDIIPHLADVTTQFTLHERLIAGDHPPIATLIAALDGAANLPQEWRALYANHLLTHALEKRDTEAARLIADEMDADPRLDKELTSQMYGMLSDTPDLVYVFMRQRLSEGESERWQTRLLDAASSSMSVAITAEDPELILSWLRLLAREPDSFGLESVLHDGIHRALPLTYQDREFALSLLILVCRFVADLIDTLLTDEALMEALPADVRDAFALYERDAIANLQSHSTSLFLTGIGRAANAHVGATFEAGLIERLWALNDSEKKYNNRSPYTPERILTVCVETGADWLPSASLETLLGLLLTKKDHPLYPVFTEKLAEKGLLATHLPGALIRATSNVNTVLDTVTMLHPTDKLTPAKMADVYVIYLNQVGWNEPTQPLMGALARILQQHPDVHITLETLNRLMEQGSRLRDELIARVAALAILNNATGASADRSEEPDADLVEQLRFVFSHLAWSTSARSATLVWWRSFVQAQPPARLSRLDEALSGVRVLDDALETLRSVTAMRRLIGKHDVQGFAEAINTAYEVLETLAESFEPSEKGNDISFDPETVRATLVHMMQDLTPHQRQILSNSMKGLAGLIARMGDNRTRPGIARRSDSVDRQLITGEQMPGGAVDAMKWMAGFFSGAQNAEEDEPG